MASGNIGDDRSVDLAGDFVGEIAPGVGGTPELIETEAAAVTPLSVLVQLVARTDAYSTTAATLGVALPMRSRPVTSRR